MESKTEQEKIVRLIDYLQRISKLNSKAVYEIDEYERVLWLSEIPREEGCFVHIWENDEPNPEEWIVIQGIDEPACPLAPVECEGFYDISSLFDKNNTPELYEEIVYSSSNNLPHKGNLEYLNKPIKVKSIKNYSKIEDAWDKYIKEKWIPWKEKHNKWERIHKIYISLFSINQEQIRVGEEYELVLGTGLITWKTPSGKNIRRHLLVTDIQLVFEANLKKFTIQPNPNGCNFRAEFDMFDDEDFPGIEKKIEKLVKEADDNPWNMTQNGKIFRSFINSIHTKGQYSETMKPTVVGEYPTSPRIEFAPAIILRKRPNKGHLSCLIKIKDIVIKSMKNIPETFIDLSEIKLNNTSSKNDFDSVSKLLDGELLFPKPANEEQRLIVEKLKISNGVLIQGPPGTGKSHTIANLISHLLAKGQRILITAKSPRALKVLERLIPKDLLSLCVCLLGVGSEERKSMESSINGILNKLENWNESLVRQHIKQSEETLKQLRMEQVQVNSKIKNIRESETRQHCIVKDLYVGTAARIAELVNAQKEQFEWFKDEVQYGQPCPISSNDLFFIIEGLRKYSSEKRKELSLVISEKIIKNIDNIEILLKQEKDLNEDENRLKIGIDNSVVAELNKCNHSIIEGILDSLVSLHIKYQNIIKSSYPWTRIAIKHILNGNSNYWNKLLNKTKNIIRSVEKIIIFAENNEVSYPEEININTLLEDTRFLIEYVHSGGKLRFWFFKPKAIKERQYITNSVKINGKLCDNIEQLQLLSTILTIQIQIRKIGEIWEHIGHKIKGPLSLQIEELNSICNIIQDIFLIKNSIEEIQNKYKECIWLKTQNWQEIERIITLINSCKYSLFYGRRDKVLKELKDIENQITCDINYNHNNHPLVKELLQKIIERDLKGFSIVVEKINAFKKEQDEFQKLNDCLKKLKTTFPKLSNDIESTYYQEYWDKRVLQINDAWNYMQAKLWVENYTNKDDIPSLTKRYQQIEEKINSTIEELASLYAWSFCFSRLKEEHRRHMELWYQSMKRLGKGTGKHAFYHRREAQNHLNRCREAVPAWIMPLHRIWDTVDPSPGMFDVIIIDEASQCGLESLPLFFIGKKILIVGDDKQISPEEVGISRDAVHQLMREYLFDFEYKSSFEIESSLFDHGKLRYGNHKITLREHFRCMPEIISFSNQLWYSDTPLIPLRQYGTNRLPPLEHVFVDGGYREGSGNYVINRPEAEAIVKRISNICCDNKYKDKTIGVIVLQGEGQARLIETMLVDKIGAEEIQKRKIVCGNPYSFQGDERDVILLSLVAANNERIGPLTKSSDERRFNVAASRARDQMILFHSVNIDDLSIYDLRRKLLEFFINKEPNKSQSININKDELEKLALRENRSIVEPPKPFESWFEVDVALELIRRSYKIIPQYKVAKKRIDIVVEGDYTKLAIECDGDRWHGPDEYERDLERQKQLERCGWKFFRIRESLFYVNKDKALEKLWLLLEKNNIFPGK